MTPTTDGLACGEAAAYHLGDLVLNIVTCVYQPDLQKMKTWKMPKVEIK
jgi:hypothetical protein